MAPLDLLRKLRRRLNSIDSRLCSLEGRTIRIQEGLGRIESRSLYDSAPGDFRAAEFRVFSQWGEDGILQNLLRHIPISKKIFVEFGVGDYTEANTRFLLVHENWSGLVIDGDIQNISSIREDEIYWRYNLKAEHAFVTRETINQILSENAVRGEIGLLSIDIDGNDYWVWDAIEAVSAAIIVVEYNSRFGAVREVTVPYKADFIRRREHYSNIYYGASLAAFCSLGRRKGYAFVGCNTAGNNAFFVRLDLIPPVMPQLTPQQGFVAAKFRESLTERGSLAYLTEEEEAAILKTMPLVKVS